MSVFIHSPFKVGNITTLSQTLVKDATSVIKTSSEESFHSALSTSLVNLSHHMVCPILSSSVLLSSYTTFLSRCCLVAESEEICPYGIETDESLQRSAQRGNVMFVKVCFIFSLVAVIRFIEQFVPHCLMVSCSCTNRYYHIDTAMLIEFCLNCA